MTVAAERLLLTPVADADTDDLVLLHSDPNVSYWYAGAWSTACAREWSSAMAGRWRQEGTGKWMARLRPDGTLVGRGGLRRVDLEGEATLEPGWTPRDAARGHGYATEISRAALDVAVGDRQAQPVVAPTEVHNHASASRDEASEHAGARTHTYDSSVTSAESAGTGGRTRRGSRTPAGPSRRGVTSQQPRHHMCACAHRSRKGVWYHQRSHQGARSSRGDAPPGGSQFHAASRPLGTDHPPGERTRSRSLGRGTPGHGSLSRHLCHSP